MGSVKLAQNYSTALFDLALAKNMQDDVLKQLDLFVNICKENLALVSILDSPLVAQGKKNAVILSITQKIKLDKILQQFLLILVKNMRIAMLPEIKIAYEKLLNDHNNVKAVEVRYCNNMNEAEKKILQEKMETIINKKLILNFIKDPAIIGGVVVKYDSNLLDWSIKGALSKVTKLIQDSKVSFF